MRPIQWYWRRARVMSPGELLAVHAGRRIRDRLAAGPPRILSSGSLEIEPVTDDRILEFGRRHARAAAEHVRRSEEALRGTVRLFGRAHDVPRPVDWHIDPWTRQSWRNWQPTRLPADHEDLKPVWELNRQQWLPDLALAYRLTGEERFARDAVTSIDTWIDQNPWRTGVNWTSPTELAIRLICWIWTLHLLGPCPPLDEGLRRKVSRSACQQAAYIAGHLSIGSSANNHLVAEAAGLLLAGRALGSARWRDAGEALLAGQAGRLIAADGTGAEQSVAYLLQTLEYYLLALPASPRLRRDAAVRRRLEAAAGFLSALTSQGPRPPAFGDDDGGGLLWTMGGYPRAPAIVNALAAACGRDDLRRPDWDQDPTLFWLDAAPPAAGSAAGPATVASGFPDGGYYRLEAGPAGDGATLWFRCGPLGLAPLCGHAHCDALSLTLSCGGDGLIADTGTCTYRGGDPWRAFFRGTSAHSTIRVDGAEQSRYAGPFLVAERHDARCVGWVPGAEVAGEITVSNGARCRRRVRLTGGGSVFEVVDEVEASGDHLVELFFHASPHARVRGDGGGAVSIGHRTRRVTVRPPAGCSAQLYYGDHALPLGWCSPGYGEREPCFTLASRCRFRDRVALVTTLEVGACAG